MPNEKKRSRRSRKSERKSAEPKSSSRPRSRPQTDNPSEHFEHQGDGGTVV